MILCLLMLEKCVASWIKIHLDFEVKLWNKENFDFAEVQYVNEAFLNKRYALVSDYIRL